MQHLQSPTPYTRWTSGHVAIRAPSPHEVCQAAGTGRAFLDCRAKTFSASIKGHTPQLRRVLAPVLAARVGRAALWGAGPSGGQPPRHERLTPVLLSTEVSSRPDPRQGPDNRGTLRGVRPHDDPLRTLDPGRDGLRRPATRRTENQRYLSWEGPIEHTFGRRGKRANRLAFRGSRADSTRRRSSDSSPGISSRRCPTTATLPRQTRCRPLASCHWAPQPSATSANSRDPACAVTVITTGGIRIP
jgi:hypothetical protein